MTSYILPTNQSLIQQGLETVAHGSGLHGTFTFSDFFGCMSAIPYSWEDMYSGVNDLQTIKLENIYDELFLAVDWLEATVTVQYSTRNDGSVDWHTVTGVTLTNTGGGYGRGSAPPPQIIIAGGSGATAECNIQTSNVDPSTFGKVTSVTLSFSGIETTTIPTVSIQAPPTASLPVQSNGDKSTSGVNVPSGTAGWPSTMSEIVQGYIDQANSEIQEIYVKNTSAADKLNTLYANAALQMQLEQRERFHAIAPVPIPRDVWMNPHPTSIYTFVDSIPNLSQNTDPHMSAQTLEAISDASTVGGSSLTVQQRQERNQSRLNMMGIPVDNAAPDSQPSRLGNQFATQASPTKLYSIPARLNINYTSDTIVPSTYSIEDAINLVVSINCECWCD